MLNDVDSASSSSRISFQHPPTYKGKHLRLTGGFKFDSNLSENGQTNVSVCVRPAMGQQWASSPDLVWSHILFTSGIEMCPHMCLNWPLEVGSQLNVASRVSSVVAICDVKVLSKLERE